MGDSGDVICLSSDDETVPVQSSVKKFKTDEPVKTDLKPQVRQPDSLKRKTLVANESRQSEIKKPKICSNGLNEEAANSSASKSPNGTSKSSCRSDKIGSRQLVSAEKLNVAKTAIPQSNNELKQKSNSGIVQNEAKTSKNSNDVVTSSIKTKIPDRNAESRNLLSKQSSNSGTQQNVSYKNESSQSKASRNLEDKKKVDKTAEKTQNPTKNWVREEFSDLPNINITPIENSSKVLVAKPQERRHSETAKLSESDARSSSNEKPKEQPTNNTPKCHRTKSDSLRKLAEEFGRLIKNTPSKTHDNRYVPEVSSSPEIEIVEVTKLSKNGSVNGISNNKVSGKPEKLQLSMESLKITSKNNEHSSEMDNSVCSKDENKVRTDIEKVSSSEKNLLKTPHKPINPGVNGSKIDENFDKESSPKVDEMKKKLKPIRITSLQLMKPKSHESNLKDCDVKNGDLLKSSVKPEDEKNGKKPFEPVAGCSKTPDVFMPCEPKKKKHKPLPNEMVFMSTPWKPMENEESTADELETLEEHKSCSKPHLVVKTKEPASVEQDTFAIFLSLCLQLERSPEMEKIVAKLKRNYDQLDPAYSRSRTFRDFLNKTREKILAKGRIYYFIGQVADEMKFRRKQAESSKLKEKKGTTNVAETKEADGKDESSKEENHDDVDNGRESRRLRQKIKTIEMAMKSCAKRIQQLEVSEVDLDDDNNSNYIKLERYKSKMVELYTKLCEYTNEHPDAGRAYLRPKHLRVTQIPSIDQAINSFINSKLTYNRKKAMSGKSFIDGLIFPDYIDILECVGKVNDEQKLGLDKRRQQQLAKEAFTQLGKHLQEARQRDYWDTFSENLEKGDDPAAADVTLAEKLLENQKIAEKNTSEIFEEYVRKQEQRNAGDRESTHSESEHDDDDEDDDDEEKSNRNVSDAELSGNEDSEESSGENEKETNSTKVSETLPQSESDCKPLNEDTEHKVSEIGVGQVMEENIVLEKSKPTIEESEKCIKQTEKTLVDNKSMEIEVNQTEDDSEVVIEILAKTPDVQIPQKNKDEDFDDGVTNAKKKQKEENVKNEEKIVEASAEKIDNITKLPDEEKKSSNEMDASDGKETLEIEVNHAEADAEEEVIEASIEQPKILRIRSFAKPPSSWASSQQSNPEDSDKVAVPGSTMNAETIDLLDDEPENLSMSVPKVLKSSKIVNEVGSSLITTKKAVSPEMEKFIAEVSRKIEERKSMVKKTRSTIIIRSPNKSSPNQIQKITKTMSNEELSLQKIIGIASKIKSSLENRKTLKNHQNQDLSIQKQMTIVRNSKKNTGTEQSPQNSPQQSPSFQKTIAIASISKISPGNRQLSQNRPQQSSVQKQIGIGSSSNKSPVKNRQPQAGPQRNTLLGKQIVFSSNRLQQSFSLQKNSSTTLTSPRKIQSYQNQAQLDLSMAKQVAVPRITKTSPAKSQLSQNNRLNRNTSVKKVIGPPAASKGSVGNSQLPQNRLHQVSSVQKNVSIARISKTSSAKSQFVPNRFFHNPLIQKIIAAAASKAQAENTQSSPTVLRQSTTSTSTVTEKVTTQNVTHNIPLQDQLISLANRRVFSLDSPLSIEVKGLKKVQNASLEQLTAVKIANNNDQIRINSNNFTKDKNNKNINSNNSNNNNNKKNNLPKALNNKNNEPRSKNNFPRANTAEISSALQPLKLAKTTNVQRGGLEPVQQSPQLQAKPSNSQALVRLRVAPNPQILHSVQQQLKNVSKATIRPLSVSSIQAEGITLKSPRFIKLSGNSTVAAATGARSTAYPAIQNPVQRNPRSSNNTDSIRTDQSVTWQPIQRTNSVLKPHTSNNTPLNYQRQQNLKHTGQKYVRTPPSNEPPKK